MNKFYRIGITLCLLLGLTIQPGQQPVHAEPLINVSINAALSRKAISPYIYGLNFAKESFATEISLPIRRWGGNLTSRYNWQTGYTNTASDWYFENTITSNSYDWGQTETNHQWVDQNIRTGTDSLITIPMIGYVSKNGTSCSFSVAKYGSQQEVDPQRADCGKGVKMDNSPIVNNPLDTSVAVDPTFMKNWVLDLVNTYGDANNGGVKFFALDNEPELWSETHRDVHPGHQTYDELREKSTAYGYAIKKADPTAKLLGYVSFGWSGYWYSKYDMVTAAGNGYSYFPDYATHGNKYQVEWYLAQMKAYEQEKGVRLLDYLDLHYYPENGVSLQLAGDAAMQALRLRSTRSLWDSTYRDESWIGGDDQAPDQRYVRLIPRMHQWVDENYPGTLLAITEYNFGGLEDINGALAQADTLGIFGREGLDMATLWNYPYPNDPLGYYHFETLPGAYAFRMFRNYDGNGGKFGDTSVNAVSDDQSQLSVYAAERTSDSAMTLMVINKTSSSITSNVSISNFTPASIASVYRYSDANLGAIVQQPDQAVSPTGFSASFPPNSITIVIIPKQFNPYVTNITRVNKSPNSSSTISYTVNFSEDVTGVDGADFSVSTPNITGAFVTGVTGTGKTYTVGVNTGSGNGILKLNLVDDDSIVDIDGNPLGGTGMGNGDFFLGETYLMIKGASLPAPKLITPAQNRTINDPTPAFDWSDIPNADHYEIQIDSNAAFTTFTSNDVFTSNYTPGAPLADGIYFWRVRAYNASGSPGKFSPSRSFHIDTTPPSIPTNLSPADNSTTGGTPVFRWAKASERVLYEIQIDNNNDFQSAEYTVKTRVNYFKPVAKMPPGTYYWHVRAMDQYGNWSNWSATFILTVTP